MTSPVIQHNYGHQIPADQENAYSISSTQKIKALYKNPHHSEQFWARYEKEWLPAREKVYQKKKEEMKPTWKKVYEFLKYWLT